MDPARTTPRHPLMRQLMWDDGPDVGGMSADELIKEDQMHRDQKLEFIRGAMQEEEMSSEH